VGKVSGPGRKSLHETAGQNSDHFESDLPGAPANPGTLMTAEVVEIIASEKAVNSDRIESEFGQPWRLHASGDPERGRRHHGDGDGAQL